jgi:hypothetical protein
MRERIESVQRFSFFVREKDCLDNTRAFPRFARDARKQAATEVVRNLRLAGESENSKGRETTGRLGQSLLQTKLTEVAVPQRWNRRIPSNPQEPERAQPR